MRERKTFPCIVPALVISRVVYTASEARRRQAEDEGYWGAFIQVCTLSTTCWHSCDCCG
jgi:hypothetical protein